MLDDKMQILGKLSGIADGEEIYAARYIGNIAYFITYHNTDPLFAVATPNYTPDGKTVLSVINEDDLEKLFK